MARKRPLEENEFRLRPRQPRAIRDENKAGSRSFKKLIHLVRMTSKRGHSTRGYFGSDGAVPWKNHLQRCAIRLTYSSNRVRGQWAAHGRYIARGSATKEVDGTEGGFSSASEHVDVAKMLSEWQSAGDLRLFKMIISPEFGERLDLRRHTRGLIARMEEDLGVRLEWAATAHFNTDHPHVHVALRGRTDTGPLRLDRAYIKHGIRHHAENLCTAQLGFRTELDALEAERREVDAPRITSLDRTISKHAFRPDGDGTFDVESLTPPRSEFQRARCAFLAARLRTLANLGLSTEIEQNRWQIDPAFLSKLRKMQVSQGRQKTLARTGHADASRQASLSATSLQNRATHRPVRPNRGR